MVHDRGGPFEREVFEDRPECEVAEDMGLAQIGATAGNRRSRPLQFALSRVFVPFNLSHPILRNEKRQHKHRNRDRAPINAERQEHGKKREEAPEESVEIVMMAQKEFDEKRCGGDECEGPRRADRFAPLPM